MILQRAGPAKRRGAEAADDGRPLSATQPTAMHENRSILLRYFVARFSSLCCRCLSMAPEAAALSSR